MFWQQDIYSMAMRQHLRTARGRVGSIVGALFQQMEKFLARTSAWVVVISDDFMEPSSVGESMKRECR